MTNFFSHELFSYKMAVTTVLFWFSLIITVIGSNGFGELTVLHSPASLGFIGSSEIHESAIKDIFCASLGLSVEENSKWNGLVIRDPFATPESVVELYIDGVSSLGSAPGLKGKSYSLMVDEYEPDTFDAIKHRINQRFVGSSNNLINIRLSDLNGVGSSADVFANLKVPKPQKQTYMHLKYKTEEDYQFLVELEVLKAITAKVNNGGLVADNNVDFINLRFLSLHPLSDLHGPDSLQVKEAKKLLGEALEQMTAAFVKAYDGSVLVTVVTTDVAHTRRVARSADLTTRSTGTRSDGYSADYAAIFNIILWFGVIFSFTLMAIVYVLIDMDPGRDSIIYRMTSTRMKKDN